MLRWVCLGLAVWLACCCCAAAEDPEPPKRPRPELVVTVGHASAISSVAFSGDGAEVLSGSYDGSVILWNTATGANLRVFRDAPLPNVWPRETGCVDFAAFAPADGKVVAATREIYQPVVVEWDTATGRQVRRSTLPEAAGRPCAMSRDARLIINQVSNDDPVVWDTVTGNKACVLADYGKGLEVAAFSHDGRNVVTGAYDEVARWNAATGKRTQTYRGVAKGVRSVAYSRDGRWVVAGCEGGRTMLWDADSEDEPRTFAKHDDAVVAVAVSLDGKVVVTGSDDNTAVLWDTNTGRRLHTLRGHADEVSAVAISRDGKRALTGSYDKRVILWDVRSGKRVRTFWGRRISDLLAGVGLQGRQAAFALPNDQTIVFLDTTRGKPRRLKKGNRHMSGRVVLTPDGKGVLVGCVQAVDLYDAATGKHLKTFNAHGGHQVPGIAVSSDGRRMLTAGEDRLAMLWDLETGHRTQLFSGHSGPLTSAVMGPTGDRVLTGSWDQTAILWDVDKGTELHTLRGHTGPVTSVAVSPDGKELLTGSVDKTAILWDAATGKSLRTFSGHRQCVWLVMFAGGRQNVLTVSGESTLTLWDAAKATRVWASSTRDHLICTADVSEDKTQLVTVGFCGSVCRWQLATGREIARIVVVDRDQEWLVVTPEGYFDGSPDACQLVTWRMGDEVFPMERFAERFHRPDLVARALAGQPCEKEAPVAHPEPATVEIPEPTDEPSPTPVEPVKPLSEPVPPSSAGEESPVPEGESPELLVPDGHKNSISSVAFSPDGRRVLTGGKSRQRVAFLWDVDSGRVLRAFRLQRADVNAVAFGPQGRRVLTGQDDGTTILWNADSGEQLRVFRKNDDDYVRSVAFSPDGNKVLIAGNDTTPVLWDAGSGEQLVTFQGHTGSVHSVAFSPDGRRVLTGSGDKTAALWDAATGERLQTFDLHKGRVKSVAFSRDGRSVLVGAVLTAADLGATLWDATTGKMLKTFGEGWVDCVDISPHGRWVITARGGVSLWDMETGEKLRAFVGHSPVAFSPGGRRVLTGGTDNIAILWDVETGKQVQVFRRPLRSLSSISISPDGSRLVAAETEDERAGKAASVWELKTGKRVLTLRAEPCLWGPAFRPDGKQVLGNVAGHATLWDASTGKRLRVFPTGPSLTGVAFSPDGRQIVAGTEEKTAFLLDAATGKTVREFDAHAAEPSTFSFSPDGRHVLAGGRGKEAVLWDAATGKIVHSLPAAKYAVHEVAFSRDGRRAITCGDETGKMVLWDVAKGTKMKTIGDDGFVISVAVSPDPKTPRHVLTGRLDGLAVLWDIDTGEKIREFRGHVGAVTAVAFSPDGARAYTASRDSTIRIWDTATARELARIFNLDDHDQWLTVTPQGYYDGSPEGCKHIAWRVGDKVFPVTRYEKKYHRPDVVVRALGGDPGANP